MIDILNVMANAANSIGLDQTAIVTLGGVVGGAVRSIIGYKTEAPEGESFKALKLAKSVIWSAIAGGGVIYGLISTGQATFTALGAFFSAAGIGIGGDVVRKAISEFRQPPED